MSRSSFNSFSVISFSISLSLLTASPTSSSSIKAFQEFNEEFACVKGHGRFSPPASRLLRAGVLTNYKSQYATRLYHYDGAEQEHVMKIGFLSRVSNKFRKHV